MRDGVKRLLPKWAITALKDLRYRSVLRAEFRSDSIRYRRYGLPGEVVGMPVASRNLEAQLTKDYHRIEKGLALPAPKRPFGAAVRDRIEGNISLGREAGTSEFVLALAESAKQALRQWNSDGVISDEIAPIADSNNHDLRDIDGFFRSRRSVRDFEPTEVSQETLCHAVSLALHSPSVCNRQSWSIRFFRGDDVSRVLAYQNGNSGFSHVVPVIALVTVDTRLFAGPGERNQPWIEGGIFSMSFVWALHALGVDSCMLNMSVRNAQAAALREELGLPDSELIVMMIAIGYARAGHRVARSVRRQVQEVIPPR